VLSEHEAATCVLSEHEAATCVLSEHEAATCVLSEHEAATCVLTFNRMRNYTSKLRRTCHTSMQALKVQLCMRMHAFFLIRMHSGCTLLPAIACILARKFWLLA
jgi:hypothetical protein